ncbi:FtsX-like permease family protein [Streptomyces sp. MST-110588]|uniref:ABC transporter permease n=1 Tax=Streptomyces sp. MST-110588 TaxID=2833628 RepID=UPI001F5DF523|nr:FtsX-like permease family protein [Streptomyces sp. MST-110588]UNO38351.1 FtsX-like permease family protein [Streptomyces sp. MST-110588]UNO43601.1 FtsX-like permease family protein [Streptomyces sp. MST-110588]
MLSLALSTLRHRKGGFAATFVAMFFGAALIMACGGLMESGVDNAVPSQRFAAAPVVVAGDQSYASSCLAERVRLDSGAVRRVAAVPGVREAVPEVSFPVAVVREGRPVTALPDSVARADHRPLGHGWESARLAPYRLTHGTAPTAAREVVLDADLAKAAGAVVGDKVLVTVQGRPREFRLTGVVRQAGGRDAFQPAVFFTDAQARTLSGHPRAVDAIGVRPASGTDAEALGHRIERELGGKAVALTGDERGLAEFPQAAASRRNLLMLASIFGGWAVLVAMFGAASTLGLTTRQRLGEMALMKAIGTTPKQLRRMILGETLAVCLVASVLGCLPGALFSRLLFDKLISAGIVSAAVEFRLGALPGAVAVAASLLAGVGAAYLTARRIATTRATEAPAQSARDKRRPARARIIWSALFLLGGLALAATTMTMPVDDTTAGIAAPACILWAIALALLAPGCATAVVAVLKVPLRAVSGLPGRLAILNSRMHAQPMAATVTPIVLLTGIATGTLYMQQIEDASHRAARTGVLRADHVLTSHTGGLAPGTLERVRKVAGVTAASAYVTSTGFVQEPGDPQQTAEGWPLQGVSDDRNLSVRAATGSLAALRGNSVALPVAHAASLRRAVGDTVTLRLGDGAPVKVTVVATYRPQGLTTSLLLPAALLAAHTTDGTPTQIVVQRAPGADPGTVTAALRAAVEDQPGAQVSGSGALSADRTAGQQQLATINYLVVGMITGYTVISVVNTLVSATGRRRREFGLQRLTGFTRRQVMTMMAVESGLTAVTGILLGSVAATITVFPYSLAKLDRVLPCVPVWIYWAVVAGAATVTLAATLLPAWRATRFRPAQAATSAT